MIFYLFRRLIYIFVMLFGISVISFFVIHLAPGGPLSYQELNPKITKEIRERLKSYYGLDKPLYIQYLSWAKRMVKLDFGRSFMPDRTPVLKKIGEKLPITLAINLISLLLTVVIAIPLGVFSALKKGRISERIITTFLYLSFSIPGFWLAIIFLLVFSVKLGVLPISGIKSLSHDLMPFWGKIFDYTLHLILPVLVYTIGGLAVISRYMSESFLEVLEKDYIKMAKAKGLKKRRIIWVHALRNSLLPIITILGLQFPSLFGGSVIIETIFGIPGMGQLFYSSVMARDYPTIMGILTIGAFLTLLGNLLADLGYIIVDPRIRDEMLSK